jgi:hypothetical protein
MTIKCCKLASNPDDAMDLFPENILTFKEDLSDLITLTRELTQPKRTVMIDTMYLIQLGKEDFEEILRYPYYCPSQKSSLKGCMAAILKDILEGKIDACLSNNIMREFVGRMPKKFNLLEIYKRHIVTIAPKQKFESEFFNLAAAINSCMNQFDDSGCGDVKDSYSYLLAIFASASFFVTEDKHLDMIYQYLNKVREMDNPSKTVEALKIESAYLNIADIYENEFPFKRIIGHILFTQSILPVPVSLQDLKSNLPEVLDRYEMVIWILRSIAEIEWLKTSIGTLPDNWDEDILVDAKRRITEIAHSVGIKNTDQIDEFSFRCRIVENEKDWHIKPTDEDLGYSLESQFSILHQALYEQQIEDEKEYDDLEAYYTDKECERNFNVKCQSCGSPFELEATYTGVVDTYEREMGVEKTHEWIGDDNCPECDAEVSVHYDIFEYPYFVEETDDLEFEGCELLPKEPKSKPISVTLDRFFG